MPARRKFPRIESVRYEIDAGCNGQPPLKTFYQINMNIQETIISRTYENKFGEFFITLKVKAEDITLEEREASRAACREGTLMEVALEKFQPEGMAGEHTYAIKKKPETPYQRFKRVCIDYSGEDYYNRLKKHLGVEHLKDLEIKHSPSMVKDLIEQQMSFIDFKITGNLRTKQSLISSLTHKDNAYNLWLELFNDFNNPKNETISKNEG